MSGFYSASTGEVTVRYSAADFVALNLGAWRSWLARILFPFLIFAGLQMIPVFSGEESLSDATASFDWILVGVVTSILVAASVLIVVAGYSLRRWRGKRGEIVFGLTADGPTVRGIEMESTVYWRSIKRVKSTRERLLLYLSSTTALIIPRRCFADATMFERWVEFSERNWSAARSKGGE